MFRVNYLEECPRPPWLNQKKAFPTNMALLKECETSKPCCYYKHSTLPE